MEESQLIEKFETKLDAYKKDFEATKKELSESFSNEKKSLEEAYESKYTALEEKLKESEQKSSEFAECAEYITDILESFKSRLSFVEEEAKKKTEAPDEDEEAKPKDEQKEEDNGETKDETKESGDDGEDKKLEEMKKTLEKAGYKVEASESAPDPETSRTHSEANETSGNKTSFAESMKSLDVKDFNKLTKSL